MKFVAVSLPICGKLGIKKVSKTRSSVCCALIKKLGESLEGFIESFERISEHTKYKNRGDSSLHGKPSSKYFLSYSLTNSSRRHRRRCRLKSIHSRSDTNRTGAEGLSFYYPRLLHCLNQMLAVVSLSQHRVFVIQNR